MTIYTVDTGSPVSGTNYHTIQAAVDAASAGDTITVAAGTYTGGLNITKALTIESVSGNAADVVIQGTFRTDNSIPLGTTVGDWLETAVAYTGAAGAGITVSASGVTIQNLTVTSFNTGIELGSNDGLTLTGVNVDNVVTGVRKGTAAVVTNFEMTGGTISDSYHGMAIFAAVGAGAFDQVTIDGVSFERLTEKGIYAEQLSNAVITNVAMDDVGEWGRGPAFGPAAQTGEFGNGIDVNLKYGTYSNIEISNFTFNNVGSSAGPDTVALDFGAAISIKARDDAPSYSGSPATASNVTVHDGTISGTSTGIRVGEPGKNIAGPTVSVTDVAISGATVAPYDNVTQSALSVTNADGSVTLVGGSGNDTLNGTVNNDQLTGNGGTDTAALGGSYANATISFSGGHVVVTSTTHGVDTLTGVEKITFADKTVWLVDAAGVNGATGLAATIAAAAAGDVIQILDGTHSLGTSTLNIDKTLTIVGQSEAGVIIDASAIDGYGIYVTADSTSLSNFTLWGPAGGSPGGNYGIKANPNSGDPSDRLLDLSISDVTVQGSLRTEIDLNGVNGATLTNITAIGNNTGGVGIALTDTANVTLTDIATSGNNWGSVALYPTNTYYNQQLTGITFAGTYTHAEALGIYAEDVSGAQDLGSVTFPASFTSDGDGVWKVTNDAFRGAGSGNFTYFFANEAQAVAFAIAIQTTGTPESTAAGTSANNTRSVVEAPDGTLVVAAGLSIQAAIDASSAGDTIEIGAGTFAESVSVNKAVTLEGANSGTAGAGTRGAESIVTGQVTVSASATLSGFQFQNGSDNSTQFIGVAIQGASNVTIEDTRFWSTGPNGSAGDRGIQLDTSASGTVTITDNLFGGTSTAKYSTANWQSGIWSDGTTAQLTISNNTFDHVRTGINADGYNDGKIDITGNTFQASGTGISVGIPATTTYAGIAGNTFNDVDTDLNLRNVTNTVTLDLSGSGNSGAGSSDAAKMVAVLGGGGADSLTGSSGADYLDGNNLSSSATDADVLSGLGGNDILLGQGGTDTLSGGAGNDTLNGGAGVDLIDGGADTDTAVYSDAATAAYDTASGKWKVTSADGVETLSDIEVVQTSGGNLLLVGGGGFISTGEAVASGISGTILVSPPTKSDGDDLLSSSAGNDTLDGGKGSDTADFSLSTSPLLIDISGAKGTAYSASTGIDTLVSIENIIGGSGDDNITGNGIANMIDGGAGNDTIKAGSGNDTLMGGTGSDTILGGAGNDTIDGGDGEDSIFGEAGNDTITGGKGKDAINGGSGNDTIDGGDDGDILLGDNGNDTLLGGGDADTLIGGYGNDTLDGGAGSDVLDGGFGNDTLHADNLDAVIQGGAGTDTLMVDGATGVILEDFASASIEKAYGSDGGNDLFKGENVKTALYMEGRGGSDELWGGSAGDKLYGGTGVDLLMGGGGNDTLEGGADFDELMGGLGIDTLKGGAGEDILRGDAGNDRLYGGADGDVFVYDAKGWGRDTIYDFENGKDKLDFGGSGLNLADLKIQTSGTSTVIWAGTDAITLLNTKGQIDAGDFIGLGAPPS